jgi:hypothetical protein
VTDRAPNPDKPRRDHAGRYLPGTSGNPSGVGTGSRRKSAISAQAFLDEKADEFVRMVFERAVAGDPMATKAVMDRVLPTKKERTVEFNLPPIATAADVVAATNAIAAGVGAGELTPAEASAMSALVGNIGRAIELNEHERRITELEKARDVKGP